MEEESPLGDLGSDCFNFRLETLFLMNILFLQTTVELYRTDCRMNHRYLYNTRING